jgi:CRISPR-associated protein Cmr6
VLPAFEPGGVSNAGLTFAKWLAAQEDGGKTAVPALLDSIRSSGAPEVYRHAFERWLSSCPGSKRTGTCQGPLAIGLGNESPLEVGMTFHHTYGTPVIPGSAIKGLLRRAAKSLDDESRAVLFGQQDLAGAVRYFDAWYDPSSVGGKPFHRDVVTVHHPEYYRTRGKVPPTDFDDPTPVPFLVVRPGAKFVFSVEGPSEDWEDLAFSILSWALENLGVGAKTNAGYGRMVLEGGAVSRGGGAAAQGQETWIAVHLTYVANKQEIETRHEGKRASAKLADLESMPEEVKAALAGKSRTASADVVVAPVGGRNYRIVEVRPMGGH